MNNKSKTRSVRKRILKEKKLSVKRVKGEKVSKECVLKVYDSKGKEVESIKLDPKIFSGIVNKAALYQVVRMYNANQRQGTASTKTRGDVSGGGKKPWRQKGTGRARAGSTRSPLWRHGGVIFGPHPRDYHYDMPDNIKRLALLSSLNSKFNDNKMIGIESVVLDEPKTKKMQAIIDALKLAGKNLFILDEIDNKVKMASRNLKNVMIRNYRDFNTMDVLRCDNIILHKAALIKLAERVAR